MTEKFKSPFPDRKIMGQDFSDLVNHVNATIENSDLSHQRLNEINSQIDEFSKSINLKVDEFKTKLETSKSEVTEMLDSIKNLNSKLEGFYGKLIEIFGIFIAIITIIIAGIQISFKAEGSFTDILIKSCAIFIPITFAIVILMLLIRWIIKK